MKEVEIFEQPLIDKNNKVRGKMAILRGGLRSPNPVAVMNTAVSNYVEREPHNQFIEINMDNPWLRVVISGINEVDYEEFKDQRLKI
jgi:hypothetical protein